MSFDEFHSDFNVTEAMLKTLVKTGEKYDVTYNEKDFNKSKVYLKILLKAHMARNIYDDNAFYKVINDINEVYQQAIKLLDKAENLAFFDE